MILSAEDRERNRKQFDCLIKKILREEAANAKKEIARRSKYETVFSELTESQFSSMAVTDEYPSDKTLYTVLGFDVEVRSDLLSDALGSLSLRKREVILLSYFMDMTDVEIAWLMSNTPANIHYHRTSALDTLKNLLKRKDKPNEKKSDT